jgi:2-polyprenyl-6-hydroxyphenyl methylase/3-demethylubiquinone-9 3-methyltransferase
MTEYHDYGFEDAAPPHTMRYLLPAIFSLCGEMRPGTRVLDVGCGNGYVAGQFLKRGCTVVGVDLGEQGITLARATYPTGRFEIVPADDQVLERLNEQPFDIVVSTEVIEHLYAPRSYARGCYAALTDA